MICASAAFAPHGAAQTFTTLHNFSALNNDTNNDGAVPVAGLVLAGETLFGTAGMGGTTGNGVVFAIEKGGTGFRVLHQFVGTDTNDGEGPFAGLIEEGGTLYGTTTAGGSGSYNGTVFAIATNGTGYSILHSFEIYFSRPGEPLEGAGPQARLTLGSNMLYGTTLFGGDTGSGTIFALSTDGTGFKTLFAFTGAGDGKWPNGLV